MQTRRHFVATSATALLAAATPRLLKGQPVSGSAQVDLFSNANLGALHDGLLTEARLMALIGTLFMIFVDEQKVDYSRLVAVRKFTPATPAVAVSPAQTTTSRPPSSPTVLQQFTLIFSNQQLLATQGSYLVDHGTLGRVTLFLVPSATVSGEPRSTAYFNLIKQTAATGSSL